jgi:DNA polymerase-1
MAQIQRPLFGLARPKIDLVVDVSNLAFRAAFRFKDLSHREVPTGHIYGSLSILMALKRHYDEKHDSRLVFALDGHCKWRRELLPEYKRNRGQRSSSSAGMMEEVIEVLGMVPGLTIKAQDDEADDVIAAHCAATPTKQHVVFSMDRDLWQLSSSHMIRIIRATKDPPISTYDIDTDFFTRNPRMIPLSKTIIGDTSDNIPGVKGFSREDLRLILQEMTAPDVDDLMNVTARLDEQKKLKPRTLRLLQAHDEHIRRMLQVTTLRRDCRYEGKTNVPDRAALKARLTELACTSLLDRLDTLYGKEPT